MKKTLITLLALASCSAVNAAVYTDNFNRADSASLGANWTSFNAPVPPGIVSNQFSFTGDSGAYNVASYTAATALTSNFTVDVDFTKITNGAQVGLLWNINATGNTYYHALLSGAGDSFLVQRVESGTPVAGFGGGTISANINNTDSYHMSLVGTPGGDFALELVNTTTSTTLKTFSFTDTAISGGQAGIYSAGWGWNSTADNFALNTVPEPGTIALISLAALGLLGFSRKKTL